MNLQAKRIQGGRFSSEDKLEVLFDDEGKDIGQLFLGLEVISGAEVTHGGGETSTELLHYKQFSDANEEGIIDYSSCIMDVVQTEKGTSVIKVIGQYITVAEQTENRQAYIEREEAIASGELVIDEHAEPSQQFVPPNAFTDISTGEVTLEWLEDTPV